MLKLNYDNCKMFSNCLQLHHAMEIDPLRIKKLFKLKGSRNKIWEKIANDVCKQCPYKKYLKGEIK